MRRVTHTRGVVPAALAGAAIVTLAGCGGGDGGDRESAEGSPQQTSQTSSSPRSPQITTSAPTTSSAAGRTSVPEQARTALRAVTTAEAAVQGGEVFDLESDTDAGERVWEAKVAGSQNSVVELEISADGTKVLRRHEVRSPGDDVDKLRSAEVSLRKAVNLAVRRVSGKGRLSALEIDTYDNSTVVWQITFGGDDGTTMVVDASSGDILAVGEDAG